MINHFWWKSSKFCVVPTIRFCSNFTSMWSKCLSNNVWRDFRLPMSASAIIVPYKIPDRKINFNSKFTVKTLPYCRCWCWHWKSRVSPYNSSNLFVPYTSEIWTKSYGPNYTKFWAFWQKSEVSKTIFDKALTPFWKTFLWLKQLFNAKLFISRLPSFSVPTITVVQHV